MIIIIKIIRVSFNGQNVVSFFLISPSGRMAYGVLTTNCFLKLLILDTVAMSKEKCFKIILIIAGKNIVFLLSFQVKYLPRKKRDMGGSLVFVIHKSYFWYTVSPA